LVIVSLPWRTSSAGSIAVPLMHALRFRRLRRLHQGGARSPLDPQLRGVDPRRPGSSAAPVVNRNPCSNHDTSTSCLRICGCQRTAGHVHGGPG